MAFMGLFSRHKPKDSSAFSVFVRTASSRDRKRVYTKVLEKATERQKDVLKRAADAAK